MKVSRQSCLRHQRFAFHREYDHHRIVDRVYDYQRPSRGPDFRVSPNLGDRMHHLL